MTHTRPHRLERRTGARTTTWLVLAAAGAVACGDNLLLPPLSGGGGGGGTGGGSVTLAAVAGDGQQGTVGQPLADSLVVRVLGAGGAPLARRRVAFVVSSSAGVLAPDTTETDAEGRASARWVLGTTAGSQTAVARVVDTTAAPASFAAEALPAAASAMAAAGGDNQHGDEGSTLANPLVVRVTDRFGNPVAGVDVSWRVTRGGGSVSDAHSTTGADGRASVSWTLGDSGRQQATATDSRLSGSPVQFDASIS